MALKFSNNASTIISAGLSTGGVTVTGASLADFPSLSAGDYTYATLAKAAAPDQNEIVKVTAISGNAATIVREQQGTSALAFTVGDTFELRLTSGLLQEGLEDSALPDFFQSTVGDKIFIIQTGQSNPQGYEVRSVAATVDSWYNPRVWDYADRTTDPQVTGFVNNGIDDYPSGPSSSGWGWRNPNPTDTAVTNFSVSGYIGYMGGNTGNQVYAMANEIQLATNKDVYVLSVCQGAAGIQWWESTAGLPDFAAILTAFSAYILAGSTGVDFQSKIGPDIVTWGQSETNADPNWASGIEYLQPAAWAAKVLAVFAQGKSTGWIKDGYTKIYLTEPTQAANWVRPVSPYRWEGCQTLNRLSGDDVTLVSSMGIPDGDNIGGPASLLNIPAPDVHFTGLGNDEYGRRIADVILGRSTAKSFGNQELYRELLPKLGGNLDVDGKSLVNGSYTYTFPSGSGEFALDTDIAANYSLIQTVATGLVAIATADNTFQGKMTFTGGLISKGDGANSFRAGKQAGETTQGGSSTAIGYRAGQASQGSNGIIISATGAALNDTDAGHIHIASNAASLDYTSSSGWSASNGAVTVSFPSTAGTLALTSDVPADNLANNNVWTGSNEFQGGTQFKSPAGTRSGSAAIAGGAPISQGNYSVAIGSDTAYRQGNNCVDLGVSTGTGALGDHNTHIGTGAAQYGDHSNATAIGCNAGRGVATGSVSAGTNSVSVGYLAARDGSGAGDVCIGTQSMFQGGTTGGDNIVIGNASATSTNTLGARNVFLGTASGGNGTARSGGSYNVGLGFGACYHNDTDHGICINSTGAADSSAADGDISVKSTTAQMSFTTLSNGWNFTGGTGVNVSGSIVATGNVSAQSDERLKTEVATINNPLDVIRGIRGVIYTDIKSSARRTGVIAQDVKSVLPEAVEEDKDGIMSVAYGNLVGVCIEAIKELQSEIINLRAEIHDSTGES